LGVSQQGSTSNAITAAANPNQNRLLSIYDVLLTNFTRQEFIEGRSNPNNSNGSFSKPAYRGHKYGFSYHPSRATSLGDIQVPLLDFQDIEPSLDEIRQKQALLPQPPPSRRGRGGQRGGGRPSQQAPQGDQDGANVVIENYLTHTNVSLVQRMQVLLEQFTLPGPSLALPPFYTA